MLSENLHIAVPLWLGTLWWLPLILAGTIAALIVWRDPLRAGWRLLPLALLLLAIYPPQRLIEEKIATLPTALIIKDLSISQQITGQIGRVEKLATALQQQLDQLKNVQVEEITISGEADSAHTNIWQAYQDFSSHIPYEQQAGIFLVSDGQIHDLPTVIPKKMPPWHMLLTGPTTGMDDQLQIIHAPPYALQNKPYQLTVKAIRKYGMAEHPVPPVSLPLTITTADGSVQQFSLTPNKETVVTLQLAQTGAQEIVLSIPPQVNDAVTANNHAIVPVQVQRTQLNILLLSGAPSLNTRVWRDVLKREPQVNLVHFIILRDATHQAAEAEKDLALIPLPLDTLFDKTLLQFDWVILDDFAQTPNFLPSYATALNKFVQTGGGLLIIDGQHSLGTQSLANGLLADIWPSEINAAANWRQKTFQPKPTLLGQNHPLTAQLNWQDHPAWHGQAEVTAKPGTQIWLTGDDALPLLLGWQVGQGRVAELTSNELWRWARSADETPWFALLQNLDNWLLQTPTMADPQFALTADLATAPPQLKLLIHSAAPNVPPVLWQTPDMSASQSLTLKNGVAEQVVPLKQTGLYTAQIGKQFKAFLYAPGESPERDYLLATDQIVKPLVQATGGAVQVVKDAVPALRWVPIGQHFAGTGWLGLRPSQANQAIGIYTIPLLPNWVLLILVLCALAFTWWREGR